MSFLTKTNSGLVRNRPDYVAGFGFRCALTCLRPSFACDANQQLATMIDAQALPARLTGDFISWALAIEASAERRVALLPLESPDFGADERLAVCLIAACQLNACPAFAACAEALLGSTDVGRTLTATRVVAKTLQACRMTVEPEFLRPNGQVLPYVH